MHSDQHSVIQSRHRFIVRMIALQATASILLLSASDVSAACPDNWLDASFMEMGCLFFNNTAAVNWEEANMVCKKYSKSTLVDIQLEMQMGFLQMELDLIANTEGTTRRWWTAGTDMWREGRWIWITTLTAVEDNVWSPGQPGDTKHLNCLALHPSYGYLGYDEDC